MSTQDSTSANKRIAKNTMFMYIRMTVMMCISLVTTRITFQILGVDDYGIYNIVGSVIVFFTFINQAFTTATRRYITAEIATGNGSSKQNVFSLALLSHGLIALAIVVIAEVVGLWLVNGVLNIPNERLFAANIVYQMSVLSAIVGIMQAPYTAAITAHERMSIYAYISIIEALLKLVGVTVLYFTLGDKLIIYSITVCLSIIITQTLYRIYCKKQFAECHYTHPRNKTLLKEMFKFMGWSLFGQWAVVMTNQGVSVLVNVFFSIAANAAMGISNQITNIVSNFVNNFQVAFQPQITKLYVRKEHDELISLAIRSSRISSYLVMLFMVPIIFQVHNFLTLWLGKYPEYAVEFTILTLICIFIDACSAPMWMIIFSDTNLRTYQIGQAFIFSLNFIFAWGFLYLGLPPYSVITARIVVYIFVTIFRLYQGKEKVPTFPLSKWFMDVYVKAAWIMLIPSIFMYYLSKISYKYAIVDLLVNCSICCCLIVVSIYFLGLQKEEKNFAKTTVLEILHLK